MQFVLFNHGSSLVWYMTQRVKDSDSQIMSLRSLSCSSKVAFQVLSTTPPILASRLPEQIQYFQGNCCGSARLCVSFMIRPSLPPTLKRGQEGQLWPQQALFIGAAPGFPETIHLPSHTGRPSGDCHAHC